MPFTPGDPYQQTPRGLLCLSLNWHECQQQGLAKGCRNVTQVQTAASTPCRHPHSRTPAGPRAPVTPQQVPEASPYSAQAPPPLLLPKQAACRPPASMMARPVLFQEGQGPFLPEAKPPQQPSLPSFAFCTSCYTYTTLMRGTRASVTNSTLSTVLRARCFALYASPAHQHLPRLSAHHTVLFSTLTNPGPSACLGPSAILSTGHLLTHPTEPRSGAPFLRTHVDSA